MGTLLIILLILLILDTLTESGGHKKSPVKFWLNYGDNCNSTSSVEQLIQENKDSNKSKALQNLTCNPELELRCDLILKKCRCKNLEKDWDPKGRPLPLGMVDPSPALQAASLPGCRFANGVVCEKNEDCSSSLICREDSVNGSEASAAALGKCLPEINQMAAAAFLLNP